jgi:hypothetical protein
MAGLCQAIEDRGAGVERNIGEDLVWPARERHGENVSMANPDRWRVVELGVQTCGEFEVLLDRDYPTAPLCESVGDQASTGAKIEDQVASTDAGGVEQTVDECLAVEEVLRNAEWAVRDRHGDSFRKTVNGVLRPSRGLKTVWPQAEPSRCSGRSG